jgi:hypothetical protein
VRPIVALLNEYICRKEKGVTAAKSNVCVVVLGDKISDSNAKRSPSDIWRTSTWEIVHQAIAGTA